MTRKFFFCFPLRAGNIVFGYIVITICLAVIGYNLYELGLTLVSSNQENGDKFKDFSNLESIFGQSKDDVVRVITVAYYISYISVAMLLLLVGIMFTCGAYKANNCLVSTFFVYSFFHLFFTILLVVWEALSSGWIQVGLIALSDVLLILCLFSVKYLLEAIRTGHIYSSPGEVLYKY